MVFRTTSGDARTRGFTLIELLVVVSIVGVLSALVAPSYLKQNARARETVLRHNLHTLREALDDYRSDNGRNPDSLDDLVASKYLRALPLDPLTGRNDSWKAERGDEPGIHDVRSGARGDAENGSSYANW